MSCLLHRFRFGQFAHFGQFESDILYSGIVAGSNQNAIIIQPQLCFKGVGLLRVFLSFEQFIQNGIAIVSIIRIMQIG